MSGLRSPLSRVLGAGSAKDGTGHFWSQRVSAAGIVLLALWFLVAMPGLDGAGRGELIAWIGAPMNSVLLLLLALATGWHSNLGIQVIIEDYVHGQFIKVVALIICRFAHLLVVAVAMFTILKIALGGTA